MQNDVLKNEIAPWQEKGRWYHITIKSNGTAWILINDKTDPKMQGSISSGRFVLVSSDKKERVIDLKFNFKAECLVSTQIGIASAYIYYINNANNSFVYLGDPTSFNGEVEIWVFVIKNN